MDQFVTMTAAAAIGEGQALVLDSTADALVKPAEGSPSEQFLGVSQSAAEVGESVRVQLFIPGTIARVKSGGGVTITRGGVLYIDADGYITDDDSSTTPFGVALTACGSCEYAIVRMHNLSDI